MESNALLPKEVMDFSERAHRLYMEQLQTILEPAHIGQFVAIHPDTGEYAVARTSSGARFALRERLPQGMIVTTKIGASATDTLAHRILASQFMAEMQK